MRTVVADNHRFAFVVLLQLVFEPDPRNLVLAQGVLRSEICLAVSDLPVVIDAEVCMLHQLPLCPIELKAVVRPEGRTEKPNAFYIDCVIVEKGYARPFAGLAQGCAQCPQFVRIELMVAGKVEHWNGPVLKQVNRTDAVSNVAWQHEDVCVYSRSY